MASVFKRGGKEKIGDGRYIASYFDENGKRKDRTTGTADYDSACQIAAKWETEAALRKSGVIDPTLARFADNNRQHITEHVDEYLAHCEHVGQNRKHIRTKCTQIPKDR